MNNNQYASFQKSAEGFIEFFASYRHKRIVLYGLGQYTATLLSIAKDFNFIGLMDGDENNIGHEIYGLKVLGIDDVQNNADLIVINTSPFYWNLIFERIADIGIPVYFPNGEPATRKAYSQGLLSEEERCRSVEEIKNAIDDAEIISFDIYDTLVMRKVFSPQDIFKLTEQRLKCHFKREIPYREMRNRAVSSLQKENYTLEELCDKMQELYPNDDVNLYKAIELEIESAVTTVRKDMLEIYWYAVKHKKEIYLLSDMYLSSDFLLNMLTKCGIKSDKSHLWVSGEMGISKNSRCMWEKYINEVVGKKKALHIGDSQKADIEYAQEVGIQAIKIAGATDMLKEIIPTEIWSKTYSLYGSLSLGMLADELFNSPFSWKSVENKYHISTCRQFGRVVFGNVVLTYLLWLLEESRKRGISKLIFLSRDGYLLRQNYLYLIHKLHIDEAPAAEYLFISRKAVLTFAAKEQEAFLSLLALSYTGTFRNYLNDRFDLDILPEDEHANEEIQLPQDKDTVKVWMTPYYDNIYKHIANYHEVYGNYINEIEWDDRTAIVDICYTGTIQYWLSRVLNRKLTGFYWIANTSENNIFLANNKMISCFQRKEDCFAEKSEIWKNHKIVESLFTAPYGMMKTIDDSGEFISYETGQNQKYFMNRELINQGCNEYASHYISLLEKLNMRYDEIKIDSISLDSIFGNWFQGAISFSKSIKECFYHEDGFINSGKEISLF